MTTVFIRTYKKDFCWLKYCLQSLKKYLTGYDEIVIVTPETDYKELCYLVCIEWNIRARLEICSVWKDDYIGQQNTKLLAFQYVRTEKVMFVDSDLIFTNYMNVKDLMVKGQPCILKTPYDSMDGDVLMWKGITEKLMKCKVEYEYMRRIPLLYNTDTLRNLALYFHLLHGISISEYMLKMEDRSFSEFNMIGSYAEKMEAESYFFLDTAKEEFKPLPAKQFWSWGGLTPEIETEIKSYL